MGKLTVPSEKPAVKMTLRHYQLASCLSSDVIAFQFADYRDNQLLYMMQELKQTPSTEEYYQTRFDTCLGNFLVDKGFMNSQKRYFEKDLLMLADRCDIRLEDFSDNNPCLVLAFDGQNLRQNERKGWERFIENTAEAIIDRQSIHAAKTICNKAILMPEYWG